MLVCYIDESGDTAMLPTPTSNIQPLFCILGIAFDISHLWKLTLEFSELKRRFFPRKLTTNPGLSAILAELKGSDLRNDLRTGKRDVRRHHLGFLDNAIRLLELAEARLFGRIWVKAFGTSNDDAALYTSSVQHICQSFDVLLQTKQTEGLMIADSRSQGQNRVTSFSIFTQKFQRTGDAYPRLVEMPTFGHSENHAGIQLVDLLVSLVIYPLAAHVYCTGFVKNVHVHPFFEVMRVRFGSRLQAMTYRYQIAGPPATSGGGLIVSDPLGKKGSQYLFRPAPTL